MQRDLVLVHVESQAPETLAVCSEHLHLLRNREIAAVALERYNILHETSCKLEDCKVSGITQFSVPIACELDAQVRLLDDFEMVIRLPDYVSPGEPKIPEKTANDMIEIAESFMECGDGGSASMFFTAAGFQGSDYVAEKHWNLHDRREKRRYWRILESFGWPDSLESEEESEAEEWRRTPEQLVRDCEDGVDVESNLIALAKVKPMHAIEFILTNLHLYRYIPDVCRASERALEALGQLLDSVGCVVDARMAIGEMLLRKGMIAPGLAIGFNPDVIAMHTPQVALAHAKKMWAMWVNGDLGPLYYNMMMFLLYHKTDKIGSVVVSQVISLLDSAKKFPAQPTKAKIVGTVPKQIDQAQLPVFRVLCLVEVFLYTQGMMKEYKELKTIMHTGRVDYFEKMKGGFDELRDAPEYMLFARSGKQSPPPYEDPAMLWAIGDETLMDDGFKPIDKMWAMFHPVAGLSLWKIKKKYSMEATAFWNLIDVSQRYTGICLQIGKWDILETIPKLLQNGVVDSVKKAMEYIAGIYASIVEEIEERSGRPVFVRYVKFDMDDMRDQITAFNKVLLNALPESATLCGEISPPIAGNPVTES